MNSNERRAFLKLMAGGGLALTSGVSYLNASESSQFDDFKVIVVLGLTGGNDALNTFIPASNDTKSGYPNYAKIRNKLRVDANPLRLPLSNGKLDLTQGNPYEKNNSLTDAYLKGFYEHTDPNDPSKKLAFATNGLMPEVAHLVDRGKVAIVANCGNLIEPATKQELVDGTKPRPPFLFSHSHQRILAKNGEASQLAFTGWGGRVYDLWPDVNSGSLYGMNMSIGGRSSLFKAQKTSSLVINPSGVERYDRVPQAIYEDFVSHQRSDPFRSLYNAMRKRSFAVQDVLAEDWESHSKLFEGMQNAYGIELFGDPTKEQLQIDFDLKSGLGEKLGAVAKFVKIGKERGAKRMIFAVSHKGYDSHSNQVHMHSKRLRSLSMALGDFYEALEQLGLEDNVVLMTMSDFARSTGNNDDGTDHAWGGSYFVMGGAVKGGVYGTMPDLTLDGEDDLTHKGRLIPTTSMSQYFATAVKWFGMSPDELKVAFPELSNFDATTHDLGFMG